MADRLKVTGATNPQIEFVTAQSPYPALVAGYGAGKTEGLVLRAMDLKLQYPEQNIAYYMPTYDLIKLVGYERFKLRLNQSGIKYNLNKSDHVLHIPGAGSIIFRSLDSPERIVGYQAADSLIDEIDTLKEKDAAYCWRQIVARNRQKKPDKAKNTVGIGTTPEGFRFTYARWKKDPTPKHQLIQASTYSNEKNLPEDYIDNIKSEFPEHTLDAYLMGEFVNLTSGSVYKQFDRDANWTSEVISENEPLHIGMDFNVDNMAAIICTIRDGIPLALDEITDGVDTPWMVDAIKEKYSSHRVTVYPDASGGNRSTNGASETDLSLLRNAGFHVSAPTKNPPIKDRVLSVNSRICSGSERKFFVNTDKCPTLTDCLEQQPYRNGVPDKSGGLDHPVDALGYFIHRKWPLNRTKATQSAIRI